MVSGTSKTELGKGFWITVGVLAALVVVGIIYAFIGKMTG
jgi:hypothetical protein